MVWITESRLKQEITVLVEEIMAMGQMNRNQHFQLTTAILSDPKITHEERCQINRVFDCIQTGRIKLVD